MPTRIGVSILGCGVVGSATAEMLLLQRQALAARTGIDLHLRHIFVRNAGKPRGAAIPTSLLTTDPRAATDPGCDIVVELMGGIEPARTLVLEALRHGKHVVTANKALIAIHGAELFAAARSAGRCIAFEAAVGGGIPLVESIRRGLIANEIDAVYGILNGTCNYILTRMHESKVAYAETLAEAQQLGYAEADPTLDVEGVDSAHKLAIVASLAMRCVCAFHDIPHHGISSIEVTDLIAGEELGYTCRLLASARRYDNGLDLSVQPTFIPAAHPLAAVRGPFNAISLYASAAGHLLLYGRGAGGLPTASAVMSDMIDVATGNALQTFDRLQVLPDRTPPAVRRPSGEAVSVNYIRVGLADRPGGMAAIASALGDAGVSIASLVQHQPHETHSAKAVPVVVVTHPSRECDIVAAIQRMERLDVVMGKIVRIPVMNEHKE